MPIRRARLQKTRGVPLAAALVLLACTPAAVAQDQSSPFRFQKPWIEEQLGVPPEPPGDTAPGSPPAEPGVSGAPADAAGTDGILDPANPVLFEPGSGADPAGEASLPPENPVGADQPGAADERTAMPSAGETQPAPMQDPGPPPPAEPDGATAPALPDPAPPPAVEAGPAAPPRPQPIRLGVLAGRDVMATMNAVEPIAETLTQTLGREVEILPLASYAAMIDAQAQRRIDGGFYSASSFALAEANCRCLEPLVAPAAADGSVAYYAIIVAAPEYGIASVADLQGRTVAIGAEDSIGARRMQLAGLIAEGVDPGRFGAVREVASAEDSVRLVVSGGADAAFAWSSMTGDLQIGYSRGTLADLVAQGELDMSEIAVVWRSSAITHGPFAVSKTIDEAVKNQIEAYLVGLDRAEPEAYDALNPYYSGGYVAVEPTDYSGLEALAAQNIDEITLPPVRPEPPQAPAAPAK
jgi:phosphonate transport system substrate-binding protein